MMQHFTDQMSALVADCREQETILEKIRQFSQEGGQFRLAIVADHPDPAVASAVATIAQNHMPRDLMMRNIVTHAEINVSRAQAKVIDYAASHVAVPASTSQAVQR